MSLYPSQIRRLEEIAKRDGKRVTQLVRAAVEAFLSRKIYERNTFSFSPPRAKGVRRIYRLLPKTDWNALNRISVRANRARTVLVREAVDGYLGMPRT